MVNLMSNVLFQFRKVKELRNSAGKIEIVTHPDLGKVKEGAKDDRAMRLLKTDLGALQFARNYCNRSDERKGLVKGEEFLGVVLTKFEDSSVVAKRVSDSIPQNRIGSHSAPRKVGTTAWLYYVEAETCKAFHVVTLSGKRYIGEEVNSGGIHMSKSNTIFVVCSGNTCRSPMAKIILEKMLQDNGLDTKFKVDSAACVAPSDTKAHPNAQKAIKELYGEDLLANHVPKKLTQEMADTAKVIIVMEEYMKGSLPPDKIITLGISDIWGSNLAAYKTCALEMQQGFQKYWPKIVNESPQLKNASQQPPTIDIKEKSEMEKYSEASEQEKSELMKKLMKKYGVDLWPSAPRVCAEVLKIAESVDYGRADHSKTVTRLMLNMYDNLVEVGLINDVKNKRILAEIIGLSHDIGVHQEKLHEEHHEAGWRMLKEKLWEGNTLYNYEKGPLALIMYGVFYHRSPVIDGKLKPLGDMRWSPKFRQVAKIEFCP